MDKPSTLVSTESGKPTQDLTKYYAQEENLGKELKGKGQQSTCLTFENSITHHGNVNYDNNQLPRQNLLFIFPVQNGSFEEKRSVIGYKLVLRVHYDV